MAVKSPVTAYADAVVAGRVIAGRLVKLAAERHISDLGRDDVHFDDEASQRAIDFFSHLTLSGGADGDKPFTLLPWQQFIVGSLFGWHQEDGTRRFRVAYVEAGKGSGKSPLAAGIGLYMMMADGQERAEVYSAAVDRDQAQILFRDAVAMVDRSPALDSRLSRSGGKGKEWNLAYTDVGSFFRPISSEHTGGRGKSGFRVHCGLLDEVHEHPSAAMVDFMRANAKGQQPLIFEITNSGSDRTSVCYAHHDLSVRVLQGDIENDAWFAYVCGLDLCDACRAIGKASPEEECPDCDDWRDESVWEKANPSLGVTISQRYLRELVAEAVAMPSKRNIVKRLNFCIWTQTSSRWITPELWAKGDAEIEDLTRQDCVAGIAIRVATEFAAMVLWFPGTHSVVPFFWVPDKEIPNLQELYMIPLDDWVRDGHVIAVENSETLDYRLIRQKLNELWEEYAILSIVSLKWHVEQLEHDLEGDGFDLRRATPGFMDMSGGCKEIEKLLIEGNLRHAANPVLRWMASNVALKTDTEGNVKPDHESRGGPYVGMEALIIAVNRGLSQMEGEAGVMFV